MTVSRNPLPFEGADADLNEFGRAPERAQPEDVGAVAVQNGGSSTAPAPDIEHTVEVLASLLTLLRTLRNRASGEGGA